MHLRCEVVNRHCRGPYPYASPSCLDRPSDCTGLCPGVFSGLRLSAAASRRPCSCRTSPATSCRCRNRRRHRRRSRCQRLYACRPSRCFIRRQDLGVEVVIAPAIALGQDVIDVRHLRRVDASEPRPGGRRRMSPAIPGTTGSPRSGGRCSRAVWRWRSGTATRAVRSMPGTPPSLVAQTIVRSVVRRAPRKQSR